MHQGQCDGQHGGGSFGCDSMMAFTFGCNFHVHAQCCCWLSCVSRIGGDVDVVFMAQPLNCCVIDETGCVCRLIHTVT